jgi:hypothetical protein
MIAELSMPMVEHFFVICTPITLPPKLAKVISNASVWSNK